MSRDTERELYEALQEAKAERNALESEKAQLLDRIEVAQNRGDFYKNLGTAHAETARALGERCRQLETALRRIATGDEQADWYYADIARAALGDPKETDGDIWFQAEKERADAAEERCRQLETALRTIDEWDPDKNVAEFARAALGDTPPPEDVVADPQHRSDDIREWDADGDLTGPFCELCSEPWPCFAFGVAHPEQADVEGKLIAAHPFPGVIDRHAEALGDTPPSPNLDSESANPSSARAGEVGG